MNSEVKVLALTDFSSGCNRDLMRGFIRYARQDGGWTLYRMPPGGKDERRHERIVDWANRLGADAIISQIGDIRTDYLRRKLRIPILVQNGRERAAGVCNLTGDHIGTGRMAAEYFLRKGYIRFAFYGTHGTVCSRERGLGFERELGKNDFQPDVFLEAPHANAQWTHDPDALGRWLASLPKPVAVFACDDGFALQIFEACRIFDLPIPSQVAVLGADNDESVCNISFPPLSSIAVDAENAGYRAAEAVHDMIRKRIDEPFDITIAPVRVFVRESTQTYAIGDEHIMQAVRHIEENYARPLGVPDLLELVPLSRRVFEKRFRKNTGMPVYQFLQRLRIEKFAEELIATDKSIERVAIECGFDDYRNVSRVFARYKGMAPSQYRRRFQRTTESG